MERWYIGFELNSRHELSIGRLRALVEQCRLGGLIEGACYAPDDSRRNVYKYLFLAVHSEQKGLIPRDFHLAYGKFLTRLKLHRIGDFSSAEMRQLSQFVTWLPIVERPVPPATKHDKASNQTLPRIKTLPTVNLQPLDPFAFVVESIEETQVRPEHNHLLYWLSAYGRGTWQQFRAACTELGIDPNGEYARRIARRLRSLGHIEMTNNGQNWFIAPTCLVQTEAKDNQYHTFLAGQRSPRLIETLHQEAYVSLDAHPYGNAPEIVRAVFSNEDVAVRFAQNYSQEHHSLRLVGLAGLKIASILPDLEGWEAQLPLLPIVKGNYTYQQWSDGDFKTVALPKETGLYQLTHVSDRINHPQLTLFYDAEREIWRKGDWYGLRFLMFRRTGVLCEGHYDHDRRELGMPLEQRWPDLYERALVLASGRLPVFRNGYAFFDNVSEPIAHMLVNKLGANFIEYRGI